MSAEPAGSEPGAEVVPLHPDGAGQLPAVPEAPGGAQQAPPPVSPARVIYADVTRAGERRPVVPVALQRANLRGTVGQFTACNCTGPAITGCGWCSTCWPPWCGR
ncbi:MAG: hypothetical protein ACLQDY_15650 [Streptosporangiaceae bacterium]